MTGLRVELSDAPADPEWDAFLADAPGGHHVQTSAWGRAKALLGWRAVRAVARRDGAVLGGCQALVRRLGPAGALAYVPRGPVANQDDPDVIGAVLDALDDLARAERLRLLKVQPPVHRSDLGAELVRRGFGPSVLETAPVATVLVDLARDEDRLLAAFRSSARSNVRKARRRGVQIRIGGEADLGTFGRLVEQTGRRQSFAPYPPEYYERIWRLFAPAGHSQLILAEHEGRALSGLLVIGFGDTAVYKMGAWAAERRDIHPNELAHWHAMRWARETGHRYYDLEGIPVPIARALLRGETPPGARDGTPRFKLGLGGEVRLFPGAFDRGRPRAAGTFARVAAPRLLPVTRRLIGRRSR